MVKYRRYYLPGGTYFFTVTLHNRKSIWLTKYIKELGVVMRSAQVTYPYKVIAMVVLPEHLHAIWELPEGDKNFSLRWRYIKSQFTKKLLKGSVNIAKNNRGEYALWQRRFWEHAIRDEKDYQRHVDYIHYNPVKHQLVTCVKDWPYSTFHRYVKEGIIAENWCYQNDDMDVE